MTALKPKMLLFSRIALQSCISLLLPLLTGTVDVNKAFYFLEISPTLDAPYTPQVPQCLSFALSSCSGNYDLHFLTVLVTAWNSCIDTTPYFLKSLGQDKSIIFCQSTCNKTKKCAAGISF